MNTKQTIWTLIAVIVLAGLAAGAFKAYKNRAAMPEPQNVTSFEECIKYYPILESYPRRCTSPNGMQFSENIGNELQKTELITIDAPRPNATIASPLEITGKARGTWYFEASFPVELQDASGKVIAQAPAQAQGEWMTENFVPFKLTLTYPAQTKGSKGTLILKKDNPSGEASRDDSLVLPVTF